MIILELVIIFLLISIAIHVGVTTEEQFTGFVSDWRGLLIIGFILILEMALIPRPDNDRIKNIERMLKHLREELKDNKK